MARTARLLAVLWLAVAPAVRAETRLACVFGDHMVLQRGRPIPVWGWDEPGQAVTVRLGDSAPVTATAGADGAWRVTLPSHDAGGPFDFVVVGSSTIACTDVLVGEVWLCSGQSNMEWPVAATLDAEAEIAAADHPRIRHMKMPNQPAALPTHERQAAWQVCSPATVGGFTACGYFMARELERVLDVPVGLLNASWGGTLIEPWTPPGGFAQVDSLHEIFARVRLTHPDSPTYQARLRGYLTELETWLQLARTGLETGVVVSPAPAYPPELRPLTDAEQPMQQPTTLYNGMIHPLVPYALRGAIWYQGESNHREGMLYTDKMEALIEGWRELWVQGSFPFYFVQIAPYHYGGEPSTYLPELWEAQAAAAERIRDCGMVVISDVGNVEDIHPRNKQAVGLRLARLALARTYGQELEYSGPVLRRMAIEGATIRLWFDHAEGLRSRDGAPLNWFEIIGAETDFVPAQAVIDGETIVLSAPEVAEPRAMRFAWHRNAEPNLQNAAGLPAGAFRAGEVPERDWLALKVPEAAAYTLVYDLDLNHLASPLVYDVDRRAEVTGRFDRIAYFLELQRDREPVQYAYAAMDAFTDDLSRIGVPAFGTGAVFQQAVSGLTVISNVDGVANGTGLTGAIEFWPHNYGPANAANVPGASASVYDFGDQPAEPADGYGCMQIHHPAAGQTVLAVNRWNGGPTGADVGIGNSDGNTRDWTFAGNAGEYVVKRLRVLVRLVP